MTKKFMSCSVLALALLLASCGAEGGPATVDPPIAPSSSEEPGLSADDLTGLVETVPLEVRVLDPDTGRAKTILDYSAAAYDCTGEDEVASRISGNFEYLSWVDSEAICFARLDEVEMRYRMVARIPVEKDDFYDSKVYLKSSGFFRKKSTEYWYAVTDGVDRVKVFSLSLDGEDVSQPVLRGSVEDTTGGWGIGEDEGVITYVEQENKNEGYGLLYSYSEDSERVSPDVLRLQVVEGERMFVYKSIRSLGGGTYLALCKSYRSRSEEVEYGPLVSFRVSADGDVNTIQNVVHPTNEEIRGYLRNSAEDTVLFWTTEGFYEVDIAGTESPVRMPHLDFLRERHGPVSAPGRIVGFRQG